jgi:hypothetical protein
MRNVKNLFFALLFTPVFFSCKKSSSSSDNNNNTTGSSMSATIDGSAWSATTVQGNKSTSNPVVLSVAGTGNGNQINIAIPNYNGAGTYSFSTNTGMTVTYVNLSNPTATYSANAIQGSGSITISTDANGVVEGSFNLTVVPTMGGGNGKSISGGSFRLQL